MYRRDYLVRFFNTGPVHEKLMYIGVLRTCHPNPPEQGSSVGQEKEF